VEFFREQNRLNNQDWGEEGHQPQRQGRKGRRSREAGEEDACLLDNLSQPPCTSCGRYEKKKKEKIVRPLFSVQSSETKRRGRKKAGIGELKLF